MGMCGDMQEILKMWEELTAEQAEIAEQERIFYERKKAVFARRREANRRFELAQEKEAMARRFWNLVQTDWHFWPEDMRVALTVVKDGIRVMKWQVMSKDAAIRSEAAYCAVSALNGMDYKSIIAPVFTFCDGVTRAFLVDLRFRNAGSWEGIGKD